MIAALGACSGEYDDSPATADQPAYAIGGAPAGTGFDKPAQPLPPSGRTIWLDSPSNVAVLKNNIKNGGSGTIRISVPRGTQSYYAKLKEVSPRRGDVLGVTIAPGRTIRVTVPLDGDSTVYELHYGAGVKWYGLRAAFGPKGSYSKADDTFRFERGTGWEVELIVQPGGNLGTSGLDFRNF